MNLKPAMTCGVALLLAACAAVGPDYKRPEISLSPTFVGANDEALGAVATRAWWQDYKDPLLTRLIERGLRQSLDVQQAQEAIHEAEAQLRQTGLNQALGGSASIQRERAGGDDIRTSTTTTSALDAAFVIDLFGGIRRERQSAQENLAEAQAQVQVTRLAWLAELIAAYANARYYQEALALTRETIAARRKTVEITHLQLEAGAETTYDVAEAEALLATAEADLPRYSALFNANVFALAALLDEPAGPLLAEMQKGSPQVRMPGGIKTGVPANLLRNRPDVRVAEAELAAAVYDIGVAEADLYPSIELSGSVGISAGDTTWSFGPSLTLPVFNRGYLSAVRDARISAAKQLEIAWRSSVSDAVQDVQTAESNLRHYRRRAQALRGASDKYRTAFSLAQENYRSGAITLLDLLDTDRSASSAAISAASAANDAAQEWATLQIAIGAGAAVQ